MTSKDYLNFLLLMTEKEIKARYKNAVLGFLWIFLNPLLQMLIIGIVFQNFVKINTGVNNYFLFIFPGLLIWNFFSLSINKATSSIVWQRNLIQKAKFPREIIPISIILSIFFNFLISLILLVIFLLAAGQICLTIPKITNLVLGSTWLLGLTIGFSLFTSALNVRYRDISFFTQAAMILWFYGSPIIYPLSSIPSKYLIFFKINPITTALLIIRKSLINTKLPNIEVIFANLTVTILVISFGIIVFKLKSKNFADWL